MFSLVLLPWYAGELPPVKRGESKVATPLYSDHPYNVPGLYLTAQYFTPLFHTEGA